MLEDRRLFTLIESLLASSAIFNQASTAQCCTVSLTCGQSSHRHQRIETTYKVASGEQKEEIQELISKYVTAVAHADAIDVGNVVVLLSSTIETTTIIMTDGAKTFCE